MNLNLATAATKPPRSQYDRIARDLSYEAERSAEVSVYISPEDVARVLGDDKYRATDDGPWVLLRRWVADRRRLGFEPTADDILDWSEGQE